MQFVAVVGMRDRDQLVGTIRSQTQLLRAALTVQRLAIERAKPDAERETGYQLRDETLIAGTLKQVQRRYAPAVEKAILADLRRFFGAQSCFAALFSPPVRRSPTIWGQAESARAGGCCPTTRRW